MAGEDLLGDRRRELDAYDGLEVLARVEGPGHVDPVALPALRPPRTRTISTWSTSGYPRRNHVAERRAGGVVVDHEGARRPGASPGRARPGRARSPGRRSRPSGRASRRPTASGSGSDSAEPCSDGRRAGSRRTRRRAIAARSPWGSTPVTDARRLGEERQVEAGAAADVEQVAARPREPSALHQRGDRPGAVDRAVLDLVDLRVVPDVRARDGARGVRSRLGQRWIRCGRARWGSGTWRRRCPGCRWARPTRP